MFGETLRAKREQLRLTQAELAELSGVHPVSISRYETGTETKPLLDTIAKLARALNCPIEELAPEQRIA